jgi:peptidoglycan/LPS O-acetylase OafA/YrhL/lysophospholipase L1-like esterase
VITFTFAGRSADHVSLRGDKGDKVLSGSFPKGGYRPEIDGLRAVAVVPVILFHAGFDLFSGGFVGVDVFFVISGYLITRIIHDEIRNGTFSIIGFYERRARRILPALLLVTFACIPVAWFWMLPADFRDFAQSVIAVNLFSSNVLFWLETGYFAPASELKPLLHTWSLGVEEQFYVLFPLLLVMLRKIGPRALLVVIAGLVTLSFGLAEWGSTRAPAATFFLLPTRAWELGVGTMLAMTEGRWGRIEGWKAQTASAAGLGLIVAAVFVYDDATPFPGVWALAPVLGAAGVIAFARPWTIVARALSWAPVVGLGLISYSAYLWHQPLFAFARRRLYDHALTALDDLCIIALTAVLAWLSWRFVERPFRNRQGFSRSQVFAGAAAMGASLIALGAFVDVGRGLPGRMPPGVIEAGVWSYDFSPHRDSCHSTPEYPRRPETSCVHGEGDAAPIELWGDSHGVELSWRLSEKLESAGVPVREMTHEGCVPLLTPRHDANIDSTCREFNATVFDYLMTEGGGAPIVLTARWPFLFDDKGFNNGEGGEEVLVGRTLPEGGREATAQTLRAMVSALLERGRRVVLVYPIPPVGWRVPTLLQRELVFRTDRSGPLTTSYDAVKAYTDVATAELDALADHPNLVRVRPEEIFCDTFEPERCVAELDDRPLYFDDDHLNSIGAGMLADRVIEAMRNRGWLDSAALLDS